MLVSSLCSLFIFVNINLFCEFISLKCEELALRWTLCRQAFFSDFAVVVPLIFICHKHFPCVHAGNYQGFDCWQLGMFRCLKEGIVITREIYILPLSSCWPTRKFWQSEIMGYSHIMVSFQIGTVLSSVLMPRALLFSLPVDAYIVIIFSISHV